MSLTEPTLIRSTPAMPASPGSGPLTLDRSVTLEQLAVMTEEQRDATLLDADTLLADWPAVRLDDQDAGRFLSGVRRRLPLADAPNLRVDGPQPKAILGSGHIAGGELISNRLLSPVEVQGLLQAQEKRA